MYNYMHTFSRLLYVAIVILMYFDTELQFRRKFSILIFQLNMLYLHNNTQKLQILLYSTELIFEQKEINISKRKYRYRIFFFSASN